MVSSSSATVPDHRDSDAKASGSVVRKLNHQAGRGRASRMVLTVSWGGMVKLFRLSRSRAPATGTGTG